LIISTSYRVAGGVAEEVIRVLREKGVFLCEFEVTCSIVQNMALQLLNVRFTSSRGR